MEAPNILSLLKKQKKTKTVWRSANSKGVLKRKIKKRTQLADFASFYHGKVTDQKPYNTPIYLFNMKIVSNFFSPTNFEEKKISIQGNCYDGIFINAYKKYLLLILIL